MNKNKCRNSNQQSHNYDGSTSVFGFWIYIMSDCILFATLFAVYAVFQKNIFNGPSPKEIFNLSFVFVETIILLISSFTFGMSIIFNNMKKIQGCINFLWITFFLGTTFILMEIYEFYELYHLGYTWQVSAFLSSFYILVSTHGFHVLIGLIWILSLIFQLKIYGTSIITKVKLTYLGLFWHFLDIIWIFVFSIVYLMGVL